MRVPDHVRPSVKGASARHAVKALLRRHGLHTVCESAVCPNIGECFSRNTATFLVLGDVCTRSCSFCAIKSGKPRPVDPGEPERIAEAARILGLKYVVITSVTRDDLPDGGAAQFARTIEAVRYKIPGAKVEALIPDFKGEIEPLRSVLLAAPDVINHNVETVPRLYPEVRPQADYRRSIELLARAGKKGVTTKSGLMLGMGEEFAEVVSVMRDLRDAGCGMLTLGQYLRPTRKNRPVSRYLEKIEFDNCREEGLRLGFKSVAAAPLVRSSYHADLLSPLT